MGMFDNYEALNKNYQPNNLSSAYPRPNPINDKLTPAQLRKPYEQYNEAGELIGYFWYYGDTLNLEFNLSGEVAIDSNVKLYTISNQKPTEYTEGEINSYIYNVVDNILWECTQIIEDNDNRKYHWEIEEDEDKLEYLQRSSGSVYFDITDILKDKYIKVNLYDFRNKLILSKEYENPTTSIVFPINQELSLQLTRGTYQCSLIIYNTDCTNTVFSQSDCVLTVK